MLKAKNRFAVLFLSVGSGHQTAAEALAKALSQVIEEENIIVGDPFAKKIEILPIILNTLQALSITIAPDIYDIAWRRSAAQNNYQWIKGMKILEDLLEEYVIKNQINIIIATHVLPCILALNLKKSGRIKSVYGVITDFGAHSLWPTKEIDGYFVATSELKNILTYRGVSPDLIHPTGIPIKEQYQKSFIKPVGKKTRVLMLAGGIRSSGYIGLRRYIFDFLDHIDKLSLKNIAITIVTGNQRQLKKDLIKYQKKTDLDVKILGFVHDIPKLMMVNDILITKPGGMIISEALAVGMCIIITQPGPGQETANAEFLARNGIALKGETPEEVLEILRFSLQKPEEIYQLKVKTKQFGNTQSASEISSIISKMEKEEV